MSHEALCRAIGKRFCRATIFELFRVVAWSLIGHNDKLAQLEDEDPRFADCPAFCTRPEADMPRGCPDCPVTQLANELREEVEEEFGELRLRKKLEESFRFKWTFDSLRGDVNAVASLDAGVNGEGVSPKWNVRERALVGELRSLRALFRRLEAKRLSDELKAQAGR